MVSLIASVQGFQAKYSKPRGKFGDPQKALEGNPVALKNLRPQLLVHWKVSQRNLGCASWQVSGLVVGHGPWALAIRDSESPS